MLLVGLLQVAATDLSRQSSPDSVQAAADALPPGAGVEGRPAPDHTSPLQAAVDRAQPGDRVTVPAGTYNGDLYIDRPLTLSGVGRPILRGSGTGSVVRIRAAGVIIEGFDIDGGGSGDLGRDTSGIHVAAPRVTVRDCRVRGALFRAMVRVGGLLRASGPGR